MGPAKLLLIGASVRAAAFSALRAQLQPTSVDLFADCDLAARCPVLRIDSGCYPGAFVELARAAPPGPWMYSGSLEHHPVLIDAIAAERPLWGNAGNAVRKARDPKFFFDLLTGAGLFCPRVTFRPESEGAWLLKPSAAGGIRRWRPAGRVPPNCYLQERIEGEPHAAVYVCDAGTARLIGVTRQLVGERWLRAAPFRYCGSIGPVLVEAPVQASLQRVGDVLAAGCGLRGLIGVDFVLADGVPWPVEVNPRYTASVEIHEYATGVSALALHRRVFEPDAPLPRSARTASAMIGKAVLFARHHLIFPEVGPWTAMGTDDLPSFADIPHAGERISRGKPILTFFVRGDTVAACEDGLRRQAQHLDRLLFAA